MNADEIIQFYEKIKPHVTEQITEFILISYLDEENNNLAVFFCGKEKGNKKILCGGHICIDNITPLELIKTAEHFQKHGLKVIFSLNYWERTMIEIDPETEGFFMTLEEIRNDIMKSGLPVYTSRYSALMRESGLYTRKRAKREHVRIDTEHICGWWKRSAISYIPLYKKKN